LNLSSSLNQYPDDEVSEEISSKSARQPTRTVPAYFITLISKVSFHAFLTNRFGGTVTYFKRLEALWSDSTHPSKCYNLVEADSVFS